MEHANNYLVIKISFKLLEMHFNSLFSSVDPRMHQRCVIPIKKIVVPRSLRKRLIDWYHTILMHPGINRTEPTIKMHFTCPKLHGDVEKICKSCKICQLTKKTKIKYGKVRPKVGYPLHTSNRAVHRKETY